MTFITHHKISIYYARDSKEQFIKIYEKNSFKF